MFAARKNEKSKKAIIEKARVLINSDIPGDIAEKLTDFVSQLEQQGRTKERKVADIDDQLNGVLDDIANACKNGNKTEAEGLCDALFTRTDMRPSVSAKKKPVKNFYTPEEVLKNMIARAEGESKKLQQQQANTEAKLRRDPYNAAFAAELSSIRAAIKATENQLNMLLDQNNRKAIMKGIEAMGNTEKAILADQSASDENYQLAVNKLNDMLGRAEGRAQTTQQGADVFYGSTAATSAGSVMPGGQRRNYAEEAGLGGTSAGRVNYAAAAGLTGTSGTAAPMGAAPATESGDLASVFAALEKTIEELRVVDKYYSYKIDDARGEYDKQKEIIRNLLIKRDTASAIDCVALDGDIDNASIALDIASKQIENFASARALNSERLKLAERAKVEKDIDAAGQLVVNGQEFFEASPDVAMFVKGQTEKRNDDINEVGAINAVADSAQAQTTSVSGGRAYGNSTSRTKDEHKYDDLKERFGI